MKYSWLDCIRNKKNIYLLILLTICVVFLIASSYYKKYYLHNIDEITNNQLEYKRIGVNPVTEIYIEHYEDETYDYGFDKILNIEHVVDMYDAHYHDFEVYVPDYEKDGYNGIIELLYGNEISLPKVVMGTTFSSEDTGVAICPLNFYPSIESYQGNKKDHIAGKDILNTTFTIEQPIYDIVNGRSIDTGKKYQKTYKIIGIYNQQAAEQHSYSCYVSAKDMEELYNTVSSYTELHNYNYRYVIVDNVQNVDYVINEITKLGFYADVTTGFYEEAVNGIVNTCNLIFAVATIAVVLITLLYIRKQIVKKSSKNGILLASGFNKKQIILYNLTENLLISGFSYILGIFIFEMGLLFIKVKFKNYLLFNNIILKHEIIPYIITAVIILGIPVLATYLLIKGQINNNNNNINLIRNRD